LSGSDPTVGVDEPAGPPRDTDGVLGQFLDQARVAPDRPAVKDLSRDLSYGQLRDAAADMATGLVGRGVKPGDRVALYVANSVDFVVAALACLWAGAVFVPLAVTDPEARLAVVLGDCAPALVIAADSGDEVAAFPESLRDHPSAELSTLVGTEGSVPSLPAPGDGDRVVYTIYTSGTTGTPKGVRIPNGAFAAAVNATAAALCLNEQTRTLCVSPFHFDGSFATLFPTLARGGAVVIRPRDALLFPRTFFNAVTTEGITYTGFSPSYLRVLVSSKQLVKLAGSALRIIALGGEAALIADVETLWAAAPEVRVFNRYGPTETTIAVTHVELTPAMLAGGSVPMGRPHPGVTFHLIDEAGHSVDEPGHVGELYIGGDQLMSGYWRSPELTAGVLRRDVVAGEVVYRTGDLVYRDDSGAYVYFDRADRVIKRSGVRISLVELTDVVAQIDGVAAATCVSYDEEGLLGIVAFVVVDQPVAVSELHARALDKLPHNMVPDRFEIVDALPLTSSSKVDERRLLAEARLKEAPRSGGEVRRLPPTV
jgi:D-alanine--poly(phosphoribitol) ligase subunit 1